MGDPAVNGYKATPMGALSAEAVALSSSPVSKAEKATPTLAVAPGSGSPANPATALGSAGQGSSQDQEILPILSFDPNDLSTRAAQCYAKMVADPADQQARIDALAMRFGFSGKRNPEGQGPLRGPAIRNPSLALSASDFEAVLCVTEALNVSPAHVLALWIIEGKHSHVRLWMGSQVSIGAVPEELAVKQPTRIRAWARSVLVFELVGSDRFTANIPRGGPLGDNLLVGSEGDHDAAFLRTIRGMRPHTNDALQGRTDEEVLKYFRDPGGAMSVSMPHGGGSSRQVFTRISSMSVASWLLLQHGLFQVYRAESEQDFAKSYGEVDLSHFPWVTYTRWNGGPGTFGMWFADADTAKDAIARRFGNKDRSPDPLPEQQLARYYSPGRSVAALANAVILQYLVESVTPWFAE